LALETVPAPGSVFVEGCEQQAVAARRVRDLCGWEVASGAPLRTQAGTSLPVCAESAPGSARCRWGVPEM